MRLIAVGVLTAVMSTSVQAGLFTASGAGTFNGETIAFTFDYDPAWFVPQPLSYYEVGVEPDRVIDPNIRDFVSPEPIQIYAIGSRTGHLAVAPFTTATMYNDAKASGWHVGPLSGEPLHYGPGLFTIDCEEVPACGGYPYIGIGPVDDFVAMNEIFVASYNGLVTTVNSQAVASYGGVVLNLLSGERLWMRDATWTVQKSATSVPEPETFGLLLIGFGALALARRRTPARQQAHERLIRRR